MFSGRISCSCWTLWLILSIDKIDTKTYFHFVQLQMFAQPKLLEPNNLFIEVVAQRCSVKKVFLKIL